MNDTHYEQGGPIFFYDAGEAGIQSGGGPLRGNRFFAPLELARKYHGIAIMWEHRFYGASQPFPINESTGYPLIGHEAYTFLTIEQALEDAVYFAVNFNPPGYSEDESRSLRSNSTPWIWIGGSYPGERAAIIRLRNPEVFFAGWASSAPVETSINGSVYFNPIHESLPHNCSADAHAAVKFADDTLMSGTEEEIAILKRAAFFALIATPDHKDLFNNLRIQKPWTPDGLKEWQVATILIYAFESQLWFQTAGYEGALAPFCNHFETWNPDFFHGFNTSSPPSALYHNPDDAIPTDEGIAATYGVEKAFYAFLYASIRKRRDGQGQRPGWRDQTDLMSWTWQLCSENGKFQMSDYNANPDTYIISRFYDIRVLQEGLCKVFHPYAPDVPNIKSLKKYGGWNMQPTNVMWTNGEMDPWRTMGVHAERNSGSNPDAIDRPRTTKVPRCNEKPKGEQVFGLVYEGAVHCQDLMRPWDLKKKPVGNGRGMPTNEGMDLFSRALDAWLPCFEGKGRDDL